MKQVEWRGMPYFDVFWRKRYLTIREMHLIYSSNNTYFFFALVMALLVSLDMHGFAERVSVLALVVYTCSLFILTGLIYYIAAFVGILISKKYKWFFMIYPIVGFAAITIASIVVELGMSSTFGGQMTLERLPGKMPLNLLFTILVETLFLTFVVPTVTIPELETAEPGAAVEKNQSTSFVFAGKSYYFDQLKSVSSQDHYVRIYTESGEDMVRARLSDLLDQLDNQNGIQPHRSHWVARNHVAGIESKNGSKVLMLKDGHTVPIARGRVRDVQAWLENQIE